MAKLRKSKSEKPEDLKYAGLQSLKIESVVDEVRKKFGNASFIKMGDSYREQVDVISTGSWRIDDALGVGGLPRGRIVEIYGPEACLDADTFIQYELRSNDGVRINHKGGSIRRLFERFHNLPRSDGYREYKYLRTEAEYYAPSVNEEGRVFQNRVMDVFEVGEHECLRLTMRSGISIIATPEHRFWNGTRYLQLEQVSEGTILHIHNKTPYTNDATVRSERQWLFVKNHPVAGLKVIRPNAGRSKGRGYRYNYYRLLRSRAVVEAKRNGLSLDEYVGRLNDGALEGLTFLPREAHVHHKDEDTLNDSEDNLVVIDGSAHGRHHAIAQHNNLRYVTIPDTVESVEPAGKRVVYDIRMESPFNNYIAAGFVVHNSGKTTLALGVVANAQRDGGLAAFIDAEHALDISLVSSVGANPNELYISQPDYGEQGLEILHMLVSSGKFAVIVVDSVAALVPKVELDGEMEDANMGLQARLMGRGLRKLSGVVSKSNTLVIFVNQIRQKIGVFFGSNETTPGGNALKFFASVRIDIRRESPIKAPDGSVLGNKLKVIIVKNKVAPPFKTAHTELLFGKGIQLSSELLDIGVEGGIIEQRGSCLYFEDKRIGQGRQDALHTLAENPDILSVLKKRIIDLRSQNVGA